MDWNQNTKRMPALLQLFIFLFVFCCIGYFLIGGCLYFRGFSIWATFLPSTWETILLPFFKTNWVWSLFITVFVGLFTDFLSSLIFPGYENEILSWSQKMFKIVKRTDETATRIEKKQNEQQKEMRDMLQIQLAMAKKLGVTVEEVVQTNERVREDAQKVPVVSISKELQAKIDSCLSEYRYEDARKAIDEFLDQHEQKDLAKLHYQKSLTYEAEINYPKAKEELETAIALDKENPVILHQYGFILW